MVNKNNKKIVINTQLTPYLVGGIMIYNIYNILKKKEENPKKKEKPKKKKNNLDFNIKTIE